MLILSYPILSCQRVSGGQKRLNLFTKQTLEIMTKQNDISPWLQRNMWLSKVALNPMVMEDTMVGSRYRLTRVIPRFMKVLRFMKNWEYQCDQMLPMWPDVTNVTRCYQCNQMLPMSPNVTNVTRYYQYDQILAMMWPHVTNFDLFLSSHQKKFCGWSIGVSGLVTGLSSKVHKELRIGVTGLPVTPVTNSSYCSYQLLQLPTPVTPVTNSSYSSYQLQLLQLPNPVTPVTNSSYSSYSSSFSYSGKSGYKGIKVRPVPSVTQVTPVTEMTRVTLLWGNSVIKVHWNQSGPCQKNPPLPIGPPQVY